MYKVSSLHLVLSVDNCTNDTISKLWYGGCMKKVSAPKHLRFATIASDVALFTLHDNTLFVRLISVDRPPYYRNMLGLPGGLIDPNETAEAAALRIVAKKARIASPQVYTEQLHTFSALDRDPRGRVIAIAYIALVPWEALSPVERESNDGAQWISVTKLSGLAYDHDEVLATAVERLRSRTTYTTLISKLMPSEFTFTELEQAYETILHTDLDKRNFRKKIKKLNILTALPRKRSLGRSRPAQLYRFASKKIREIENL